MKAKNIIKYAILALSTVVLGACIREEFNPNEDLNLSRCLQPMNLNARVNAALGDVVTFSWDVTKDAEVYVLTVLNGDGSPFLTEEIAPTSVPYQKKLEADKTFTFSVQAKATGRGDSKVAEYGKTIKTFAVKDNLFLKLADRTASSVTLSWSKEVADYTEVDRIVFRAPGNESTERTHELSADEIAAASATIEDLLPAFQYEFILFFKSASRGQVYAWTAASTEGTTEVNSLEGLLNAIKTPNAEINLKLEGSPYDIEALEISNGFSLHGEMDVDGNMPVLTGELHISDAWNGKDLFFENVVFDGAPTAASPSGFGFAIQNKNGGTVDGKAIGDLTYSNCVITNYSKGLIYEWGKAMSLDDVLYFSCDITNINADGTGGGDVFDIRQATSIETLIFTECTVSQGMRTFIRMDAGTLGSLEFTNNTLYNLCFVDNANNAGIFGLQIVPGEFIFKKNLFLGMTGKATLEGANTKYKTASDMSVAASENYFWSLPDTYFTDNFTQAQAGAVILSDSPCYNAAGGYFNILASSEISGKHIGAPKWWTPYVEEPEDLTMTVLPGAHTWNLGNAKYFSGTIKKQMVRDFLLVSASEQLPIVAENGGLSFQGAAVTNRLTVPVAGYLAFLVDKPGSVVLKASNPADMSGHIVVGVGPADGSSIVLKGGASALADQDNATKILVTTITEPSLVYVYPSGPVSLTELAWSEDVTPVNTALPTPAPKASPASITSGDATDIVVSWDPVDNANSYSVVFNGKTFSVTDPEYTIGGTTTGMLDAGSYKVEVYANPGANDIYNTESAAGVATFAVLPAGGGGEGELVVKDVESLLAAIAAGKSAVTLAPGFYDLGGVLTITAPLALKGQGDEDATIMGGFKLSGAEVGSFSLENLAVDAGTPAQGLCIELDNTGVTVDEITLKNVTVIGFTKSVIYASNTDDVFKVGDILFHGVEVYNQGTGQGMFDLRNGVYNSFTLEESTLTGGRDFLRIDAKCTMPSVLVKNNTMHNLNTSKNGNGIFYVRATAGNYRVEKNLLLNMTSGTVIGKSGATVPKMSGNYFYNCNDDVFFTGIMDKETALGGQGAIITVDPVKDAEHNDFTLVNGVVMSAGVGASKWNPSNVPASYGTSMKVTSAEEFQAAMDAAKTDILFAAGEYDLSAAAITIPADLHLSGENGAVVKINQLNLDEGQLGNILIENLTFIGDESNNFISVSAASVVGNLTVRNCNLDKIKKSVFYGNADGSSFDAVVFDNVVMQGLGGGQGTIDIRKGAYGMVSVKNCTVIGGRDFIRADAGKVTGAVNIVNNTFDGVTLNNGNGVLYVRSTPSTYVLKNNLFLNENGDNNLLSKASGIIVPDQVSGNFFYNCVAEKFWTGLINQEVALANGGVILGSNPVKDDANHDYTLVDALCLASNVGAARWNPNAGRVSNELTVGSVAELVTAIDAGKQGITLKNGTYDLREAVDGGVIGLIAPLSLTGKGKVEVIGGFKLGAGTTSFVVENITFNGVDKAMGNALEIAEAVELERILIENCEFVGYNKSLFYGNGADSKVALFDFQKNLVHGFGTGQGMLDIRKGAYGTVNISKNTFYDGGRDFVRIDKEIASSIAIVNNTFGACSIDAGNGLLWIRSLADNPSKYIVAKNLFLNLTGEKTVLAKSGATVPTMSNNWFFNVGAAFFGGAIDQATATGNGGGVAEADPCAGSAEFNFVLTNADLKKADVGDPRWNSASPNYRPRK